MRLLVLYQHAPTPGAPGIYRHRTLLAELVRRGWDVDVVASPINYMSGVVPPAYVGRGHHRELIDGIVHHWVPATGRVHRSFAHRALNYATFAASATLCGIRLDRPDVVWASSPPLSVATAGRMVARRHRSPFVLEVRDLWPESAAAAGVIGETSVPYRVLDRMARSYARSAAAAIVPTPGLVAPLGEHGARAVHLVTGVVDDNRPSEADRARVREELAIPAEACVFAYVGAHGVANGLQVVLDAARAVERRRTLDPTLPAVHVLLAGDGSDRVRLEAELAARPVPGLQMVGSVPKARVLELLAAADVGLHILRPDPVFESALPTKVLEYLGAHLPFLTTVPGVPAGIAIASGGEHVGDAADLADAMLRWAAMAPQERRRRGDQAFEWARARYGLGPVVDGLEAILAGAARSGRTTRDGARPTPPSGAGNRAGAA